MQQSHSYVYHPTGRARIMAAILFDLLWFDDFTQSTFIVTLYDECNETCNFYQLQNECVCSLSDLTYYLCFIKSPNGFVLCQTIKGYHGNLWLFSCVPDYHGSYIPRFNINFFNGQCRYIWQEHLHCIKWLVCHVILVLKLIILFAIIAANFIFKVQFQWKIVTCENILPSKVHFVIHSLIPPFFSKKV